MLDIERIKAICFDVDGTLSDTDDVWVSQFARWLQIFLPWVKKESLHSFARSLVMAAESPANLAYRMLDWLHLDGQVGKMTSFIAKTKRMVSYKAFQAIPGVIPMLDALHGKLPLAIVSARDELSTLHFLRQFNILDRFQVVVTSQTCTFTKPYPDPVLHAAKVMQVAPEHCLMVGDTPVDILSGKRAGMQTVGVLCGFGRENELRKAGADLILSSTAELTNHLQLYI
jgi:HAD superfamily hydrolase (TIGR01509 family)